MPKRLQKLILTINSIKFPLLLTTTLIIIFLYLGSWISVQFNHGPYREVQPHTTAEFLQSISQTWDSEHYFNIAQNGYPTGDSSKPLNGYDTLWAFFPLLPLELSIFIKIFKFIQPAYLMLVVGFINFVAMGLVLFNFIKKFTAETLKIDLDVNSVFTTAIISPFSIFFLVPYTESLFVLILISFFHILFYTKKIYLLCLLPILAFLLPLTRSTGITLSFAIVAYLIFDSRAWQISNLLTIFKQNLLKYSLAILSIFTNISGMLAFLFYGYSRRGLFWVSKDALAFWGRKTDLNIFNMFVFQTRLYLDRVISLKSLLSPVNAYLWAIFFLVLCAILGYVLFKKKINNQPETIALYTLSVVAGLIPLTSSDFTSFPRYIVITPVMLMFIPIFLQLKLAKNIQYVQIIMAVFYITFLYYFITFRWIG